LTIAGSDSGGGAGIQADLQAFAANGVVGTSAITALTAQNTTGVRGVHVPPWEFVDAQISAVLADLPVAAVKTGMLATAEIIELVARRAAAGDLPQLVVDPVMVASSGDRLLAEAAEMAYLKTLFPHALVVTPNLREASLLVGRELTTVAEMAEAAAELARTGARYVLVKGGHLAGDAIDVLFDGGRVHHLPARRIDTVNVHGTGCTTAAAIAAFLARGETVHDAVAAAKAYTTSAIEGAACWRLGAGHGPIDHFGWKGSTP
jgi:hydroxymethylpyrimidine/phosphomethylpyrimidine kinase